MTEWSRKFQLGISTHGLTPQIARNVLTINKVDSKGGRNFISVGRSYDRYGDAPRGAPNPHQAPFGSPAVAGESHVILCIFYCSEKCFGWVSGFRFRVSGTQLLKPEHSYETSNSRHKGTKSLRSNPFFVSWLLGGKKILKFLSRLIWPSLWPAAALTPDTSFLDGQ